MDLPSSNIGIDQKMPHEAQKQHGDKHKDLDKCYEISPTQPLSLHPTSSRTRSMGNLMEDRSRKVKMFEMKLREFSETSSMKTLNTTDSYHTAGSDDNLEGSPKVQHKYLTLGESVATGNDPMKTPTIHSAVKNGIFQLDASNDRTLKVTKEHVLTPTSNVNPPAVSQRYLNGLGILTVDDSVSDEGDVSSGSPISTTKKIQISFNSDLHSPKRKEYIDVSTRKTSLVLPGENISGISSKLQLKQPNLPRPTDYRSVDRYLEENESTLANDHFSSEGDTTYKTLVSERPQSSKNFAARISAASKYTSTSSSELRISAENLTYLFIISIHSFNAETLDNKEDINICLSFSKNELAFVHTVDESGWGEVTLVDSRKRGWVPFNYFADVLNNEPREVKSNSMDTLIESRKPLEKLLSAAGKFLVQSQNAVLLNEIEPLLDNINEIRDGVKALLEGTNCVSRSNDLVKSKPSIRSYRKKLLGDWYNLMLKADHYKKSVDSEKVLLLEHMVYAVLSRSFSFFNTWAREKRTYDLEKASMSALTDNNNNCLNIQESQSSSSRSIPRHRRKSPVNKESAKLNSGQLIHYLRQPPYAISRLNEIHELLFSYIGLILGRLDMIEHNSAGCEVFELLVHQIILLLRELLYISKACSLIIQTRYNSAYENNLDHNLDPLLSLVSELVSCIKVFVTDTINETYETSQLVVKDEVYRYTPEGAHLVVIISKMNRLISNAISGCKSYLKLIGDFQLESERQYPNFEKMRMNSSQFIERCSKGLLKNLNKNNSFLSYVKENEATLKRSPSYSRHLARFSSVRSGTDGVSLSVNGSQFLQEFLPECQDFHKEPEFIPYNAEDSFYEQDNLDVINNKDLMKNEMLFDNAGNLVGASFRATVFVLTNEMEYENEFLLSTFLLNYKSFGSSSALVEALVARFDIADISAKFEARESNGQYSSRSARLKSRRRRVCKVFRTWMQSFWDFKNDYMFLATMINFFNEGVIIKLPAESKELMEIAARLCSIAPSMDGMFMEDNIQLNPILIIPGNRGSIFSTMSNSSRSSVTSVDEKFIEEYELTKLPSSSHSSLSLPLPLLNTGAASLISKRELSEINKLVSQYDDLVLTPISQAYDDITQKLNLDMAISLWDALITNSKPQKIPEDSLIGQFNITDYSSLEISKQLTIIESAMYLTIKPFELLNEDFSTQNKLGYKSPSHFQTILNFTNLLSQYVVESIVGPNIPPTHRVERLKNWLRIALSALYFRNFNSVASIITSLQSHTISRLSILWETLSQKDLDLFEYLSKIIHPNNNYKVYRTKLKRLVEDYSPTDVMETKSRVPVVPFFNLFLQDITFINEGNSTFRNPESFRPHKIVNIDKYFKITKTISTVQFFQVPYDTEKKSVFGKRDSIFNMSGEVDDSRRIEPMPVLQEFILYELFRINTLYAANHDRGYELSLRLVPPAD
ncbi:Ras family guanine nucleotide exchange factor BUD5 Ecym_8143 [Eremothecium cymbalariae DBVPG|uniref:Ras-GEF domain-containing protein n=1 Tax=Eremothecium cymbalariae (strain CBS 270.75 / DBVPG 7215 / KCTC 17166 / NRRL Y-17582) TaxID=931890 RepID=G8JX60_ERECY|nr:Hypothetical protein Ecym_8143 [Eremothecium cymbalariae DBVPG\